MNDKDGLKLGFGGPPPYQSPSEPPDISLAGGLLTGKYGREKVAADSEAATLPNMPDAEEEQPRKRLNGANPYGGMV